MKKFILIISSIFVFGCYSYGQNKKTVYNCTIKDTITSEEKSINIDKYADELEKKRSALTLENDSIKIQIFLSKTQNKISKQSLNKHTNITKEINYDYNSKKITSFYYYYYKNSVVLIGKEYHYDSTGNISKVINNDSPENYTLCYKEAEAIVLKKVGKKYEIENINRREETINNQKVYLWSVIATIIGSRKYSDSKNFWVDSKTGKIVKVLKMRVSTDDYFKK